MHDPLTSGRPDFHPEDESLEQGIDYLCAMGTFGDLGTTFSFPPPWPQDDMKRCVKKWGKKNMTDAVSLLNARKWTITKARVL